MMGSIDQQVIKWQEPLGIRAHYGAELIRRRWYIPVGSGLALIVPFLTGLFIYQHELEQPFRPEPYVLVITIGIVVALLISLDFILPHYIRFGRSRIMISEPRWVYWIKYKELRRCELTSEPRPVFLGLGDGAEVLFGLYWNPRTDADALRRFLATKNIPLEMASEQATAWKESPGVLSGS